MCEQTEINYLDGDVVWVKLGACWWPGQVTGFHNLPEDIQAEFKKKPLIAVVKFFQEDTYEFVKNYQQIYKYNCTLKDEFIKKGLDKYRTKSKDGSRYMDKFPGDVEMAEKLTGGDPDILNQDRFCPEEKPDISALFGERKIVKKKKDRDDMHRRSDSMDLAKKITHPRFLKESDHEVRIRQQPSSLPSTPSSTGSPVYPCHLCTFTSSRVNVIICHIKSHRSGNSSESRSKVKSFTQYRPRTSDSETPKRKYVKKEKIHKTKGESAIESGKRKQPKQSEKSTKKRKTDPKIRDTILADWDDESDEDVNLNQNKSIDGSSLNTLPTKAESDLEIQEELSKKNNTISDGNEIISETEKLLKETEKLTSLQIMDDSLSDISPSKSFKASILEKSLDLDKDAKSLDSTADESSNSIQKEKEVSFSDNEGKQPSPDKDDKKALLSCFDFHEEEPSIPPVRKKGRAFHQKKEIIKEFEMSQALKTEQEKELGNDKSNLSEVGKAVKPKNQEAMDDVKMSEDDKSSKEVDQEPSIKSDTTATKQDDPQDNTETKLDNEITPEKKSEKSTTSTLETRLEIVEIVEVEKEEEENKKISKSVEKKVDEKSEDTSIEDPPLKDKESTPVDKTKTQLESKSIPDDKQSSIKDVEMETTAPVEAVHEQPSIKDADETLSERFTTETEDETVSESAETIPEQSENSDTEMLEPDQLPNKEAMNILRSNQQMNKVPKIIKKRRGRPRKNVETPNTPPTSSVQPELSKLRENRTSGRYLEKLETERTSESDTERSYTGRRRKPNKKYLESDIYVQDVDQRTFKTDESLSESDDRSSERSRGKSKGKAKRGRKSSNLEKRKTETAETIAEKELEVTHHMLDASDNVTVGSKFSIKNDIQESDESLDKSHMEKDDTFTDNESHPSTKEMLQDLISESMSPNNASLTSVVQTAKTEKEVIAPKSADPVPELPITEEKPIETKEILQQEVETPSKDAENASDTVSVKPSIDKGQSEQPLDVPTKTTVEMLPPKKSQIKKFELSQIDFFEGDTVINKSAVESDDISGADKPKEANSDVLRLNVVDDKDNILESKLDSILNKSDTIINMEEVPKAMFTEEKTVTPVEEKIPQQVEEVVSDTLVSEQVETKQEATAVETDKVEKETPIEEQAIKKLFMHTRYKGKFIPETGAKGKKEKEVQEQTSVNTFQEAFLKTLQMDKKKGAAEDAEVVTPTKGKKGKKSLKRKLEETEATVVTETKVEATPDQKIVTGAATNIQIEDNNAPIPDISNFETIEVVVDQNIEIDTKVQDSGVENAERVAPSAEVSMTKSLAQSPATEDSSKSISLDMQKIDESSRMSMSTPSPSSDTTIPVKKREMPRIIENVTLTEPMQILKSKLLDKMPQKGGKHKLDSETPKKGEPKGSPRAKVMKIESLPSNSKMKTGSKVTSPQLSLTKKLQVLKAEEAETAAAAAAMGSQNEQLNIQPTQPAATTAGEKYIQQSSQSLTDMELDINSMPFVLSEDVLTPENIEQMPVVISSIIPASGTVSATLSLTPTTQIISTAPAQVKTPETSGETSPTKKKSGTPAILKSKNKAKPTITSIKTIVPPLTGGVKGIKFQNTQAVKTAPLLSQQKAAPGKYVVVQASGGQQLRYSVQGKPGLQQKIAIPTGKGAANAQVVQQGGKVVILTSAQSGQTKMLPLNISKTLTGKVQRIMTSKGQVLCPINPQGIITSKTIIAPKGDGVSPTTSKLTQGHKILNTQGIITSKGVLTPISGTIAKTALLGTLSQGILTKGGIYTPISASALSGKTIIGSKTLVTKGATILSSPNLGTSKAILTPISQAIGGKTILSSPTVVSAKGTVLTPITGQQVKAIAAKSPSKGGKAQYQSIQHKVQLPVLQKTQKVPVSSTQGRSGQGKSATSTLVLQNTSGQKNVMQGKKVIKQTVVQQGTPSMQNVSARTSGQQTVSVISQMQQKGKGLPMSTVQKVAVPRGGRQTKAQQKIMVQKVQEPTISTVQNLQTKSTLPAQSSSVTPLSKTSMHQKHGGSTSTKASAKAHAAGKTMAQKNLLNMAMNTAVTTVTPSIPATLSLPPLEPIEPEKKSKTENVIVEAIQKEQCKIEHLNTEKAIEPEKVEEPKIAAQPQIMALPTESSDGTQTYVLVTIDEQGQIQPLDNNTLMSLEGTTQNPDGTRTLYIDPSSLGDAGTIDNIVLQFDNGVLPNVQAGSESKAPVISESFPTSEVIPTSNQDILAAALANTDFQQEISLPETEASTGMTTGLTQTSLINQTILQSTIIPPTEPISSPSVLETSLTLNQPIMTPLEVPSSLPIQSEVTPPSVVSTISSSLELPITITNPNISYISSGDTQIQIPGNSMPDIGEIMENSGAADVARTQNSSGTQYLVIPNLEENMGVGSQSVESGAITISTASYSVSIPNSIVLEGAQVQTTPSMPIIDDTYTENIPFSTSLAQPIVTEQSFVDTPVSEMLVPKVSASTEAGQSPTIPVTSEIVSSHNLPVSAQETTVSTRESTMLHDQDAKAPIQELFSSQDVPVTSEELILQQTMGKDCTSPSSIAAVKSEEVRTGNNITSVQTTERTSESSDKSAPSSMPIIDETSLGPCDANIKNSSVEHMSFEVTDSSGLETDASRDEPRVEEKLKQLGFTEKSESKLHSSEATGQQAETSSEVDVLQESRQVLPAESLNQLDEQKIFSGAAETITHSEDCQKDEPTSQGESNSVERAMDDLHFEEANAETSHESPSQSYNQFGTSVTSDSADLPSQSAAKSESLREPTQSYEPMETDEEAVAAEPPTQSFEDSRRNEASQSYEVSEEANTNTPTQSFNELIQNQEERSIIDEAIDDQAFPTQSYEVNKPENIPENLETDAELSQEGNIPSQSNDIGADGIGTSSVSTNNSGLNEDETASSSYVPETPENQERDQDQESAISTSSYEIPPCEELNIGSSSVIPDTSVRAEHTSIHDNGVPEIPTSSYNLNPDISSTHVDSVPTSSYEDQVIVEQNVSTSYEVPISMPGLEETCSQNFVTESTDHRNEPSSYYAHHQEVTASYYESVDHETNSRLEEDPQEEVTPSYYESNPQEASQSYFNPEEASQSYSSHNVSPSYYDPRPESEASQSYYSTDDIDKTEQSPSQNIEASQSFYQEQSDELKLQQQGEATPTYTERYPVDYTLENSPIERHDLVESSVPAPRPTER